MTIFPRIPKRRVGSKTSRALSGDSCGCAMSARFLTVAFLLSALWYAVHWPAYGLSPGLMALTVLVPTFAAATVGKILGIFFYRYRGRRSQAL